MTDERIELRSTHTHLFRGGRLVPDRPISASPQGVRIAFSDGATVDAELLQNDRADLAIDMPAHRTRAGTDVPAKAWTVTFDEEHSIVIRARLH